MRKSLYILFSSTFSIFALHTITNTKQTVMDSRPSKSNIVESIVGINNNNDSKMVSKISLASRRFQVYSASLNVFADYKICQWRCNQITGTSTEDENIKDKLWNEAHDRNSIYLYNKFVSLEALWVKLGQYLSSRGDILPNPYLLHMSKCQDALPPRPFKKIKKIIESEFGNSIDSIFESIDPIPLATASIAQVHKGKLLDGREVVIKVQHEGVSDLLLQDLKNLETIGETIRYLDPDFDFSPVVREWAREVPKELDFRVEAENMKRVANNLSPLYKVSSDLSIDVTLPEVIDEYVTKKCLIMTFVKGVKISDIKSLDSLGVDRKKMMNSITKSYAHQIFFDGFYSGDPHPGNILIDCNTLQPVLLDFGLTKELDEKTRFNFAKLIVAADEQDIDGMYDSLEGIGLKLRKDVPFDIELLAKFFFRDANPKSVAREESKQRRDDYNKKEEIKKKVIYIGDMVDVTNRNFIGFYSSKKGEVVGVVNNDYVEVKFTDGNVKIVKRSSCTIQKSRSPIDAWPDSFIFFERVLGLLRGLTALLDVSQSYLDVMTPYARLAIMKHSNNNNKETNYLSSGLHINGHLKNVIDELITSGDILGCQVSVIQNGKQVIDLFGGLQSPYSDTKVHAETLFPCFSVTKGIANTCIHLLVQDGLLDLNRTVASYWPEFAVNGKEKITIAHVLSHQSGLSTAGLEELLRDPFIVTNDEMMIQLMASAIPDELPGITTKYHALSFGWILDGIVRKVSGKSIFEYSNNKISKPLDMGSDFFVGLGIGGFESNEKRLATLVLNRSKVTPIITTTQTTTIETTATTTETTEVQLNNDEIKVDIENNKNEINTVDDNNNNEESTDKVDTTATTTTTTTTSEKRRPPSGPSLLMNPTFFNNKKIRESTIPAANGHFSANSLSKFYYSLLHTDGL